MSKFSNILVKTLLVLYLLFLHFILGLYLYEKIKLATADVSQLNSESVPAQNQNETFPTPVPVPSRTETATATPAPTAEPTQEQTQIQTENYPADQLLIPVKGVKQSQLQDTYNDARSAGRVHNAIDIMAAQGTPVFAAADGEIAKFFDSDLGGITIYQYSANKKLVYYYAHLQSRSDQVREKQFVKRGTIIGYVGDTGNAGAGNFHLHFSISELEQPDKYWNGKNINPYPILKNGIESN